MTFKQLNPHACKTYLAGQEGKPEVIMIDPVLDHLADYSAILEKNKYQLVAVVDTHTHADHISAGPALKDLTGCDYYMHVNAPARCVSHRLEDNRELTLGTVTFKPLYTPGHTKDSVSLVFSDRILTGDVLFLDAGGAGRDDLPGGDPADHWESLQRLLALPDGMVVYPAHEYRNRRPSSLKQQKETNPHLKPKTKAEFINYVNDLKLGPAEWMKDVLKANYACARDPRAAWIPVDVPACEVKGTIAQGANDQVVNDIAPQDLKVQLDQGADLVLLDVREPEELTGELGQLEGVVNIPITTLPAKLNYLDPEKEIISVCRSGGRAHTAAQILMQAGFKKVKVLNGGMQAWRMEGRPVR